MTRPSFFRAPRRLRFNRAGWIVSSSAVGLGGAAIGTGNNLLFLMLGAMLGFIALSGWLSEITLRGVAIDRRVPRGIQAGRPAHLGYAVHNRKRRLPSFALEVGERRDRGRGFVPDVAAGATAVVRVERVWERRGVHSLDTITISTSFPFGFFRKERDVELPGEVVVWPRTDRPVREPRPGGSRSQPTGEMAAGMSGARGEYRSLRTYRVGDDPRDVHWRSTARSGTPVVREYAREQARTLWLCLDIRCPADTATSPGLPSVEVAVEITAALAAAATRDGRPIGLVTADERVDHGTGPAQLERVLDALAAARVRHDAPPPPAPAEPAECVLVTACSATAASGWGDVYGPEEST